LVYVLACPSPEHAARTEREFFGKAPEEQRKAFRAGVEEMRGSVRPHWTLSLPIAPYEVYGVIYDTRQPEGRPGDIDRPGAE
jgi:hypothetical protein